MLPRLSSVFAVLLLAVCIAGCAPEPDPTPTTPSFTNEEEAFAAAEETYRAYVDALNRVDLSDPATFEDVYAWTTGDANAGERRSLTAMHAKDWRVSGDSQVISVARLEAELSEVAQIATCLDVSSVSVTDSAGASQVSSDRPPVQSELVTLRADPVSPTGLRISDLSGSVISC